MQRKSSLSHPAETETLANAGSYGLLCASHFALAALAATRWQGRLGALAFQLLLAFVVNQVAFVLLHLRFHARFVDLCHADFESFRYRPHTHSYGCWVAWCHHFRDPQRFSTQWLAYRAAHLGGGLGGAAAAATAAGALQALGATTFDSALPCAALLFFLWLHVQALVHEWYHVPERRRGRYFWLRPLGWVLSALEQVGFIDSDAHKRHHSSSLNPLSADGFWDIWVPAAANSAGSAYWRSAVSRAEAMSLSAIVDKETAAAGAGLLLAWAAAAERIR